MASNADTQTLLLEAGIAIGAVIVMIALAQRFTRPRQQIFVPGQDPPPPELGEQEGTA